MPSSFADPLDFAMLVRRRFSFLEDEYGYRCVEERPESIRYARDALIVHVIKEIGVNVTIARAARLRDGPIALWRLAYKEWSSEFPLEVVSEALPNASLARPTARSNRSAEEMDDELQTFAAFLRRHGPRVLTGDSDLFRRLGKAERRRAKKRTLLAKRSKVDCEGTGLSHDV